MIIQHILTEDIFLNIFNESQFHRENNIARELEEVLKTFFVGSIRRNTLSSIKRYYGVIKRKAASIYNHHEKQKFLKVVYENFYKSYNPQTLKDESYSGRMSIKWDRELTKYLRQKISKKFDSEKIFRSLYRPYVKQFFYVFLDICFCK
ncbi:type ISP restriction/modification enzyme [Okeania sp. SIO2C2]|uniref:type ISP restriction/modification enzyme n=1 Tax=Okeania sp. SIO2C2 TaxID=2607787 RepID=UPI00258038DE|nr:type ISP restriction/modification enzyme [Okeania sp. SIO2C2]